MAEFEASRGVPVPPERLFAVASDLSRLAAWVPPLDRVEQDSGTGVLHVHGDDGNHDAVWRAEPDQRRIEWGVSPGSGYAGWLQVYASGADDTRSEAVIHLSMVDAAPPQDVVERQLEEALTALAGLATAED